jgi:apolipoprotein N-acyltransferase
VMLLLSFPPYGIWPLIWFAFVPYTIAQHRLLPRKWEGLATALAMLFWLGPYLARLMGPGVGPLFQYMGVWVAVLSFFMGKARRFHELTQYRWFILQGVIDWVGFEMLRATFIPLLATNAFVGYTLATQAWMIQPVSIFSVYGMNLIIMLVNFALAQGALAWLDRRFPVVDGVAVDGRATRRWLVATAAIVAAWIGISLVILSGAPADAPTVRVAALQPNFPVAAHIDSQTPSQLRVDTLVEQAHEAAQQGAQVIFTPEMGLAFDPQMEHTEELRALATDTGAYLFISYVVSDETGFRNETVVLSPDGEFLDVYGKKHAFGEPPTPGAGFYPVYDTPLGRLAAMICHDANYTDVARQLARNGAQLIGNAVGEFGRYGEQGWTSTVFRSVENRVATVYTHVAYVSAMIDPYGRLLALAVTPQGERLALVQDVPLGAGNAPLIRLGDWLGWVCLASYVVFIVYMEVTTRRHKKQARATVDAGN